MSGDTSALTLILSGDPGLYRIIALSLIVSLSAVVCAAVIGIPLGALIALTRFRGRDGLIVVLNALMGLPPVVVGLAVYLALSRSGPLGSLGILFTPQAMIIAQTILVTPIIAALTRQTVEDLWLEYRDELAAMDVGPAARLVGVVLGADRLDAGAPGIQVGGVARGFGGGGHELLARFGAVLLHARSQRGYLGALDDAGLVFGIAAEVGAIIVVGGNIDGFTRTMTTAIALETSKGDLPLAIGLGIVLIAIVVMINALAWAARRAGERYAG